MSRTPKVVALYRYPIKGLTPEPCDTVTVLDEGRIAGDRVLGIRFADTDAADDAWSKKTGMLALVNTPGLARLQVKFDEKSFRISIRSGDLVLADETLSMEGRQRVAAAVADYVIPLNENPLSRHPERLPLRVIGDGVTPRYHDAEAGEVTLHSRASLESLADAMRDPQQKELRFRSNIAIDGVEPWEEQRWIGRGVRIGTVEFSVVRPKSRCLATHANPTTGERDLPILTTLTKMFDQERPTFAVAMVPTRSGGQIHIGDPVSLLD